ncbi:MAG TPA: alpha/beta fold hydrolase, partial [Rhizomicrobium sp.]
MCLEFRNLLIGAALAAGLIAPGLVHADDATPPRLYADSQLVTEGRFSDEIVGQGPDVIFIPGLASSRETWKATADRLKDRYRVHLIQLAGFAGEPARANAKGEVLVPTAEAIDGYLVQRHLAPATIVGHSLGGTIVLYLAERHPADLKKAMMVDALPFYASVFGGPNATVDSIKPMADAIRTGASKMNDQQRQMMLASMATAKADQDKIAAWGKASDDSAVDNALADDLMLDLRPDLAKITTPITLLIPDYTSLGRPAGSTDAMYRGLYAAAAAHMTLVPVTNSRH